MQVSLKAARVNKNLTIDEAAEKIGVSGRALWSWENGRSYPSVKNVTAIESAYDVRYEDINFFAH